MNLHIFNACSRALAIGLPLFAASVLGAMALEEAHGEPGSAVLAGFALGALCGFTAVQLFIAWMDSDHPRLVRGR